MVESIEQSKARIADALVKQKYHEATLVMNFSVWYIYTKISYSLFFQIYSRLIEIALDQQNNVQASSLLSDRAGVYLLCQQYQSNSFNNYSIMFYISLSVDALGDSNTAINLDQMNIHGHIQKWYVVQY